MSLFSVLFYYVYNPWVSASQKNRPQLRVQVYYTIVVSKPPSLSSFGEFNNMLALHHLPPCVHIVSPTRNTTCCVAWWNNNIWYGEVELVLHQVTLYQYRTAKGTTVREYMRTFDVLYNIPDRAILLQFVYRLLVFIHFVYTKFFAMIRNG